MTNTGQRGGRCQAAHTAAARLLGQTPMTELTNISAGLPHRIFAKCEFTNPSGSVKDRIGFHIVRRAEELGLIIPGRCGSRVSAGNAPVAAGYLIEGVGGDFVPALFGATLVTDAVSVADADSVAMCLRLQREEGLFVGGSSGYAVAAAVQVAMTLPGPPSAMVVMLADSGHRYASTIYDASWRAARGFAPARTELRA